MRTGSIRQPENQILVIRRQWQMEMLTEGVQKNRRKTDTCDCAAEMMSIFEYHHDNRWAHRILRVQIAKQLHHTSKKIHPTGDWLPYTREYLRELMLRSRNYTAIDHGLHHLVTRNVIDMNVPKDLLELYNNHRGVWVKLNIDLINRWIDEHCKKSWVAGWVEGAPMYVEPSPLEIENASEEKQIHAQAAMINSLCGFHKHIHGKSDAYLYDIKRKNVLWARILERRNVYESGRGKIRTFTDDDIIAVCAQAIIGNTLSDYHQNRDPRNERDKIYDNIDLIFRDNSHMEAHMQYALAKNVTSIMAMREFQTFLQGGTSRYAKGVKKDASGASVGQTETFYDLKPELRQRYREFARGLASFFMTDTPVKEIIEFSRSNNSLSKVGEGLVDPDALATGLHLAIKVFTPTGATNEMLENIRKFSVSFCKLQKVNSK